MYSSKNDQETYAKQIQKTNKQAKTKAGSMERHFQKTLTDKKNTATPNSSFHSLDAWKGEFKKSLFSCVLLGDFEKKMAPGACHTKRGPRWPRSPERTNPERQSL